MSATPLPALPINPAPPPPAQSTNSRGPHSAASFHSHLQSAQQASQDTDHADAQGNDQGQGGGNAQADTAQTSNVSSGASKPGADAKDNQGDGTGDSSPAIDLAGGVGTLVSTVLNLIDHATGDTHAGASGPAKQGTGAKQQNPATPQPTVQAAAIMPVLLPAVTPAATPAVSNSAAPQAGNALAGVGGGVSTRPDFKADDSLATGDPGAAGTPADASSLTPGLGDSTQALAGSVAAGSHAALPVATTFTADTGSPGTAGITALGNLTATAPVVPAGTTATHNLAMDAPVGSSGFAKELGQQITWLSGQDIKQAQIRLNPQDLGPLDVKVSVEHGRVDVSFVTQHPDATAAVQQSLGQLHQMLGGQGLSLGHATVGQQAQQQSGGHQGQPAQTSGNAREEGADTPVATAARVAIGLVDAFA